MAVRRYPKGSKQYVQPHFQAFEFDCKCGRPECTYTDIDEDGALALELLHNDLQAKCPEDEQDSFGVHINEGFRCAYRQQWLRDQKNPDGTPKYETAAGISDHEKGMAWDIRTNRHTGEALEQAAYRVGVRVVGVGRRFIHMSSRFLGQMQERIRRWTYRY